MKNQAYDVCIVGSGPAGLASLSAILEPYSLDSLNQNQINRAVHSIKLHQRLKVCVVDLHNSWLHSWKNNFATLDIEFLRSPALAHPNLFDETALLAYAVAKGRTDELLDSGCIDCKKMLAMAKPQRGLWKLPSTSLFVDFCEDLADSLPHDYVQGEITDITKKINCNPEATGTPFQVELDGGRRKLLAKAVILATGPSGRPIIPPELQSISRYNRRLLMWTHLKQELLADSKRILVVGGGLTAVQVVLKLIKLGKNCILCSRRPLVEKHFDIGLEWFDSRTSNKCMSEFYHQELSERFAALKQVRDGGSVPPIYMRQVEKAEKAGRLIRVVGTARHDDGLSGIANNNDIGVNIIVTNLNKDANHVKNNRFCVDQVVLACGLEPDCRQNPVVKSVLDNWPISLEGGLPSITEDLCWKDNLPLYVVGSLGALNTGPDAGNLMGIRRAAQLVANGLECRCWLREKALVNPFDVLMLGDSSDDDSVTTRSSISIDDDASIDL